MELLSAAVPLLLLTGFLALVFRPEATIIARQFHGIARARFGAIPRDSTPPTARLQPVRVHPPKKPIVVQVRRRRRRSFTQRAPDVPGVPRATRGITVQPIEQPRTDDEARSIAAERVAIAKRLHAAHVAETTIIETVWGCKRGGGRSFLDARKEFRTHVLTRDITKAPERVETPAAAA